MKHVMKPLLYAAVVLGMSVSCKKEDLGVCGVSTQELICIATLKKTPADFGGYYFDIEKCGIADVCPNCEEKLVQDKVKVTIIGSGTTKPYKYRIWGQVYECTSCPTFAPGPHVKFVYIDKIESTD